MGSLNGIRSKATGVGLSDVSGTRTGKASGARRSKYLRTWSFGGITSCCNTAGLFRGGYFKNS
jgi:hypothetical protein